MSKRYAFNFDDYFGASWGERRLFFASHKTILILKPNYVSFRSVGTSDLPKNKIVPPWRNLCYRWSLILTRNPL